jgi:DNA repair exonuclease SbcCD ATPase subunit
LVNLLYRHQREAVEGLLELGEQLAEASRQLSGPQLQQLSAQRAQVVQALVASARRLAAETDVAVSAATAYEVQSTLSAALADPTVAAQVRSGRLLHPASYAGFGPEPDAEVAAPARPSGRPSPPKAETRARTDSAAQTNRRRTQARKAVADAEAAVADAERKLAEPQAARAEAQAMCELLATDHEALLAQLADLEHRQTQAAERAEAADGAYRKAAARHERAVRALDQARERLHGLA